jgi:hypothetical protein
MTAIQSRGQQFVSLGCFSGAVSLAWLTPLFVTGLLFCVPPLDTSDSWLAGWLFYGAWIGGFVGLLAIPGLTIFAGRKLGAPSAMIITTAALALVIYSALSLGAILCLEQIAFSDGSFGD